MSELDIELKLEDDIPEEIDEFETEIDEEVYKLLGLELSVDSSSEDDSTEEENGEPKKKKRVKKIVDPFVDIAKKYFSSINSRNSKYAVFNLDEEHQDKLIFMNSRAGTTFEDYLFQYHPGDLSVQVVEFKNDDLNIIRDKLRIPKDRCMLINLTAVRKHINIALKHKSIEILPIQFAMTDKFDLYMKVIDPISEQSLIERFGFHYHNWRVIYLLKSILKEMEDMVSKSCVVSDTLKYDELVPYMDQNLIVYPFLTNRYLTDNKPIFDYVVDTHKTKVFLIDGKDIVSAKEYLKKLKTEYTLEIQTYVTLPGKCIFCRTRFEDETNIIITSRPFVSVYPFCLKAEEFKNVQPISS